jgi:hypothetical protein
MLAPMSADASTTGSASGVAVAAGTVTGPSGATMSGAPVDLYAWPTSAVLEAMKPGQTVPRTLLTTATTSSSGQYTLTVPQASLKAAVVDNGYANLEIDSPAGIWFMPYQPGAATAATETVNLAANSFKDPCGKLPDGDSYYTFTGWTLLAKSPKPLKTVSDVVGQGYIQPGKYTDGDWTEFEYTQASSHEQTSTLGVGLSGYGLDAGYSTKGSSTSTARRSEGFPPEFTNAFNWTQFNVGEYRAGCACPAHDSSCHHLKQHSPCPQTWAGSVVHHCVWAVHSIGWSGGATVTHPAAAPATEGYNCDDQGAGTNFHNDYGTAVQWAANFQVGAALGLKGVNLKTTYGSTTQTGYDTNALEYIKFNRHGYICGTNGPPSSAAQLVARPHKT